MRIKICPYNNTSIHTNCASATNSYLLVCHSRERIVHIYVHKPTQIIIKFILRNMTTALTLRGSASATTAFVFAFYPSIILAFQPNVPLALAVGSCYHHSIRSSLSLLLFRAHLVVWFGVIFSLYRARPEHNCDKNQT